MPTERIQLPRLQCTLLLLLPLCSDARKSALYSIMPTAAAAAAWLLSRMPSGATCMASHVPRMRQRSLLVQSGATSPPAPCRSEQTASCCRCKMRRQQQQQQVKSVLFSGTSVAVGTQEDAGVGTVGGKPAGGKQLAVVGRHNLQDKKDTTQELPTLA